MNKFDAGRALKRHFNVKPTKPGHADGFSAGQSSGQMTGFVVGHAIGSAR